MKHFAVLAGAAVLLSACGQSAPPAYRPPEMPPQVKIGKPYNVSGETYYPEYTPDYDRTGTASWYGPGFHGKKTASGEVFDQHDLTAAHPTLPLPSLVRVTNLNNGKSAIIRVNDRGPFKSKRLIDLSKGSAEALEITGLSPVRVQYLQEETEQYWAQMNLRTDDIQFAKNDPFAPGAPGRADKTMLAAAVVQPDAGSAQVKDTAPVMSVASNELTPPPPAPPRPSRGWGLIGEAEAAEVGRPGEAVPLMDMRGRPIDADNAPEGSPQPRRAPQASMTDMPSPVAESDLPAPSATSRNPAALPNSGNRLHGDLPFAVGESRYVKQPEQTEDQQADAVPAREAKAAPASAAGDWLVQAGVFSSEENARRLAQRLGDFHADVSPVETGGQTRYRVRLGPFSSRADAEEAANAADAAGASGAHAVRR